MDIIWKVCICRANRDQGIMLDDVFTKKIVETLRGHQKDEDESPNALGLRRLWFEAHVATSRSAPPSYAD